jgi:glutathionyl-hydroquinone reductase
LIDYPNVWSYTRELHQWPGIAATVDLTHIKRHYYMSHRHINPSDIVPVGLPSTLTRRLLAASGRANLPGHDPATNMLLRY